MEVTKQHLKDTFDVLAEYLKHEPHSSMPPENIEIPPTTRAADFADPPTVNAFIMGIMGGLAYAIHDENHSLTLKVAESIRAIGYCVLNKRTAENN